MLANFSHMLLALASPTVFSKGNLLPSTMLKKALLEKRALLGPL